MASNQSCQIEPNGAFAFHVNWYNEVDSLLATNLGGLWFCSQQFPRTLHAKMIYDCPYREFTDTITIVSSFPTIDSVAINKTSCINVSDESIYIYATAPNPPILYKLDFGLFSSSPSFSNVSYGWHLVTIQDSLGCSVFPILPYFFIHHQDVMVIPTVGSPWVE